jgi:uncharacterized membrane protein (UPF0182 family)
MKIFLSLSLLFITTLFFGQNSKNTEPALFLDSVFIAANTMKYINPDEIESVNSVKNDTVVNNNCYAGQIHFRSKNPNKYIFLTLEQIKSEYTKVKKTDVSYMINGEFIKENIDTFKLDRNYILKVEVTDSNAFYNLRKSDSKFDIINILGKTKENLDPKNRALLKGYEAIGIK